MTNNAEKEIISISSKKKKTTNKPIFVPEKDLMITEMAFRGTCSQKNYVSRAAELCCQFFYSCCQALHHTGSFT